MTLPNRVGGPPPLKTPRHVLWRLWDDILLRVTVYYGLLLGAGAWIWSVLPKDAGGHPTGAFAELLGGRATVDAMTKSALKELMAQEATRGSTALVDVAVSTSLAVLTAALLTLPVSWVYTLTRKKKGYSQTMVQSLLILPVVVAGIVMMVKHSVALAFSLSGIVAAVKFRTSLDDSKDAVYVFLTMGIGMASGVEISVAVVLSVLFNAVVLILWYTDFGRAPALEGARAQRQLERALATANRTGTFIAKLDDEVLKGLSPEQLEGIADRALRRRKRMESDSQELERPAMEALLRIEVDSVEQARAVVEPMLGQYLGKWRFCGTHREDDRAWLEYAGSLPDNVVKQQVLYDLRTRGAPHVIKCELK